MRAAERVACIFWMALALVIGGDAYRLGLGTAQEPESGFLPFWTAVLLCLLSAAQLVRLRSSRADDQRLPPLEWGAHWRRAVLLVLSLSAYSILLPGLGYLIATFILMATLFSLYNRPQWWMVLGASLLVIGITHFVFNSWLKIQLPRGILGIG